MKIEFKVRCPECGRDQTYHSYNKSVKGERRKKCERCGTSFKVREQRLEKFPNEEKDKPEGFFKYRKKG